MSVKEQRNDSRPTRAMSESI